MGVFSRFMDIISSNINALLDQAEDPEKMIKLMINEMEDTIIEIKSNCANVIGNKSTAERKAKELESLISRWQSRAELAIANGKDALAREALLEKKRLTEQLALLKEEISKYDETIAKYKDAISKLEEKVSSAKVKYQSMWEAKQKAQEKANSSSSSNKGPSRFSTTEKDDFMERFNQMEERINRMNAKKEQEQTSNDLEEKFKDLEELDEIQKELDALKKKYESK